MHRKLISLFSRIVPRRFRSEWKQEWEGEIRYRELRTGNRGLSRRSLGAFWDAVAMQPRRLEEEIFQDLRYGFRMLIQSRTWSLIAILSLALGIGANTALFSVADEVLFKTLPVRNPEELVLFRWTCGPDCIRATSIVGIRIDPVTGESTGGGFSYPAFKQFQLQSQVLSDVFAFSPPFPGTNDGQRDGSSGQFVTPNYYSALGVNALIGRVFTPEDDATHTPVAVISHRYWQKRFGLDPAVLGKTLLVEKGVFTIIGITPPEFAGTQQLGDAPDFSITFESANRLGILGSGKQGSTLNLPWNWSLRVMGRLKPGFTFDHVTRELQGTFDSAMAVSRETLEQSGRNPGGRTVPRLQIAAGSKGLMDSRRSLSQVLQLMMGIVGMVLLIVSLNVASLLLARSTARQREVALRMAMGARRFRLIRQLMTESLTLTAAGGGLGILFAYWTKDLFLLWINRITPSFVITPKLDVRVLGFAAAITLMTGILVGLAPALRATSRNLNTTLSESRRALGGRSLVTRSLLVAQIAVSVVVLAGAGLFVRTLLNLRTADVGFNTENLLLFGVESQADARQRISGANVALVLDQLQSLPGVQAATVSQYPLLGGSVAMPYITVPGRIKSASEDPTVFIQRIWHNYFDTMGMPLVAGRALTSREDQNAPKVAIVNEALAHKYFPGENPMGRKFGITKDPSAREVSGSDLYEIVGVVRDAKFDSVRHDAPVTVFMPFEPGDLTFAVRAQVNPATLLPGIRDTVRQAGTSFVITNARTQQEEAELGFARERHFAVLSTLFGTLVLALACIGLFGVLSYGVSRRTQEIGIRMALGARRGQVVGSVMKEMFVLVMIGAGIGVAGAMGTTRFIASMLYGLSPDDPATMGVAIASMIVVGLLAALLPARRAARVDPMVALRYE